jgi:hypothetical protein
MMRKMIKGTNSREPRRVDADREELAERMMRTLARDETASRSRDRPRSRVRLCRAARRG